MYRLPTQFDASASRQDLAAAGPSFSRRQQAATELAQFAVVATSGASRIEDTRRLDEPRLKQVHQA